MNYQALLGPALWPRFRDLANNARGRAIIYQGGALRYATIDEQYPAE
ncbi:MAG: hypothetical protein U0U46_16255 [Saprospiraceae bacterium]